MFKHYLCICIYYFVIYIYTHIICIRIYIYMLCLAHNWFHVIPQHQSDYYDPYIYIKVLDNSIRNPQRWVHPRVVQRRALSGNNPTPLTVFLRGCVLGGQGVKTGLCLFFGWAVGVWVGGWQNYVSLVSCLGGGHLLLGWCSPS